MSESKGRKSRVLLVAVLLLLLLLLCGLLWVYQSIESSPGREPVIADVPGVEFEFGAYSYTESDGSMTDLEAPACVAYDGADRIYVTLPKKHTVVVFDADGTNGRVFVQDSVGEPRDSLDDYIILGPLGIDVDVNGDVYVASADKAAVVVFSADGTKLREIRVMEPRYVHVQDGVVYVLSKGTLYLYDKAGNELGRFGTYGRGPDQFAYPGGVVVGDDGTIFVTDTNNYRVMALTPELEPIWTFGQSATTAAEQNRRVLAAPTGITMGADGRIYLVDGLNSYIRVFNTQGAIYEDPLGERGVKDDQFNFPLGLDHMVEDLFVVADQFNNRILGVRLNPLSDVISTEDQTGTEATGTAMPTTDTAQ